MLRSTLPRSSRISDMKDGFQLGFRVVYEIGNKLIEESRPMVMRTKGYIEIVVSFLSMAPSPRF